MNTIRKLCNDMSFNRAYNWNNIPKRMLVSVITNLEIDEEKFVLFYDSSVLETGKTGLAICDDGIYWKDISSPPGYLSWNEFLDTDLSNDDYYVYLGEGDRFFVFNRDMQLIIDFLGTIRTSLEASKEDVRLVEAMDQ